ITLSLNAQSSHLSVDDVVNALRKIEHVSKVELISMSM
ncbi:ACT domain-containing protein, partial [Staphylococcus epidermidis]